MKRAPQAVYRLQLSEHFPLKKATKLLPYLHDLGIDGIYCSPYFAAFSPHGYDIIDPNALNPLVATQQDFEEFCQELKRLGLFHIADIVPNHMGIRGDNPWWQDVLLRGKHSKFASYFDLYWNGEKILLPLLEDSYHEALKKGHLTVVKEGDKLFAQYGPLRFPVVGKTLPKTVEQIDALLGKQHYQLVDWKRAAQETSYRRFFNIGDLIGIRMEDPNVLEAHHKWIFQLLKKGIIDGLRVDHPDGLYDPKGYFDALRKKTQKPIIVEKILGWQEELPSNWHVDGTVGYEFLNLLTGLFVQKGEALTHCYERFTGIEGEFSSLLRDNKQFYTATEMAGDVHYLADQLYANIPHSDLPRGDLIKALYALLAAYPVYRSYIGPDGKMLKRDKANWQQTFSIAKKEHQELGESFALLEKIFNHQIQSKQLTDFILRFQQLSAPVMAKGFEDITLYQYNRLLCSNEVGSAPERGGVTPEEFHAFCKRKQEKWPLGFLPVSTHDTKRSMDVRMQIACLSEIPHEWEKLAWQLSKENQRYKTNIEGQLFPDPNAEYALYQNLLGVWPSRPSFARLWPLFQKSVREARVYTSWRHPSLPYESACKKFLKALLANTGTFERFQKAIQEKGEWKSLSATCLQLGAPGIVDLYQGGEDYLYLLVDPDNRQVATHPKKDSVKTALIREALSFRMAHKDLFLKGDYIPVKAGPQIIAYLRTYRGKSLLVAAPLRHFSRPEGKITLPRDLGAGTSLFSDRTFSGGVLDVADLFSSSPFAWVVYTR